MVSGLLVIDLILLLVWQLYDPLQRKIELFPLEDPPSTEDDVKIRPELEHCESINNTVWLGKEESTKMLKTAMFRRFYGCHFQKSLTCLNNF